MRDYNNGLVKTNERCIGCNKCVSTCPVIGANVSLILNGNPKMVVSDKCIHCGRCLKACNKGAREYMDDTDEFFKAVYSDMRVSLIVDPIFYMIYGKEAKNILGYLKSQGVDKIYDGGYGAEISAFLQADYIRNRESEQNKAFILNYCPGVITFMENHVPDMLESIIPVQSPVICTAIYAKKYLKDPSALAYLGPCPARKDEMNETGNLISYNVCIESLMKKLKDEKIEETDFTEDLKCRGLGALSSIRGGFGDMIDLLISKEALSIKQEGISRGFFDFIMASSTSEDPAANYYDIISCDISCLTGAGVSIPGEELPKVNRNIQEIRQGLLKEIEGSGSYEENYKYVAEMMKDINPDDFMRGFRSNFKQMSIVPDSTYEVIFDSMYKTTEAKRHIDCGSCGYQTCKEMIEAIAYGYNRMENCIHYMNDELLARYYTDDLTKIPNAEGFKANVKRLYDQNPDKEYVIGVVSLNQLNLINDLYGFSLGDAYIKKAAEVAERFTKDKGTAGRLAGGEFLVCFENTPQYIADVYKATTYSFSDINVSFPLSFRAGLFVDRFRDEPMEAIINYASLARDKIEEDGISTILFYDDELQEKLAAEAMVTSQMHAAITKMEFVPYYQPQYSHKDKKIVGAEMLCRWIKRDGSVISPGLFIPIFEKNGFIKSLDKYMWEQAFIAAKTYASDEFDKAPISVNISRVSLSEDDFTDTIRGLFEKYPIDPDYLHFEITESAYSDRADLVSRKVNELREMGFKVAVDDFGSGYSSLNLLKDMPIDILKLDMGFLRGRNFENGEIIIRNVVAMVKELKLDVISEGVETAEQAEFLRHVGCDTIQGYLYAKPMPAVEYEKLIRKIDNEFEARIHEKEMQESVEKYFI
ncbi:MAG: EAL domain-containing protein [Lachnospiraceae bacterium]|nr:EAL domain-containing protein [Lachnospiraceae bacterium]